MISTSNYTRTDTLTGTMEYHFSHMLCICRMPKWLTYWELQWNAEDRTIQYYDKEHDRWLNDTADVAEAYLGWLDKQIYGDANG